MKIALKRSLWTALFVLLIVGGWELFTFPLVRGAYSARWHEALVLHLSLVGIFVGASALGSFAGFYLLPQGGLLETLHLALISVAYVMVSVFVLPLSLAMSAQGQGLPLAVLCMLVLAALLSYGMGRWKGKPVAMAPPQA